MPFTAKSRLQEKSLCFPCSVWETGRCPPGQLLCKTQPCRMCKEHLWYRLLSTEDAATLWLHFRGSPMNQTAVSRSVKLLTASWRDPGEQFQSFFSKNILRLYWFYVILASTILWTLSTVVSVLPHYSKTVHRFHKQIFSYTWGYCFQFPTVILNIFTCK